MSSNEGLTLSQNYEDDKIIAALFGRSRSPSTTSVSDELEQRRRERSFLSAHYNLEPENIFFLKQVHGAELVEVDSTTLTRPAPSGRNESQGSNPYFASGDAIWSRKPGVLLCLRTADCLPLFFRLDFESGSSGALLIHAGWRGLKQQIISTSLHQIEKQEKVRRAVIFWGPYINGQNYLVRNDVAQHFAHKKEVNHDQYELDLLENARAELNQFSDIQLEVKEQPFAGCTVDENESYFSHRCGDSGRNLSVIMLKEPG